MDWPIWFKHSFLVSNLESNVCIITLWSSPDDLVKKIPKNSYCAAGNLYTPNGINYVLKNILANPRIRHIIVCGEDLSGSGKSLINFFKLGVDKRRKIREAEGYIDPTISDELINLLRKSLNVIDLRGKEDEIKKIILSLPKLPPFAKPIKIREEPPPSALRTDEIGFRITEKTIANAWLRAINIVMKWGELKPSEYGIDQREVLNLMIEIEGEDRKLAPWLKFSRKELENYCKAFLSPTKRPTVSYSYGERLFRYTLSKVPKAWKKELGLTFDQIEHVIRRLKENWYTRRAIASTWKMEIDVMSKYPPCLTQLTWNIKNRKLYQTAIFRSQDIYGAWPLNAFALRKLQKRIAKELGLGIGSLIIISNSAHIYANSWSDCEKILKKWHKGKEFRFEPDRCGFFTIWIERGKIVVQHHLPDGRKSPYRFEGKDAVVLYRKILQENLLTRLDHAAYLGKELARAELALKRGKKFIQDST